MIVTSQRGALRAAGALVINAFVWGVSWWPLRELQALGLHPLWATSLVYFIVFAGLLVILMNFISNVWVAAPFLILLGGLGAFLTGMTKFGLGAFTTITVFGLVVAGTMYLIHRWHLSNLVKYKDEVEHLLAIARSDKH